MNTKLLHEYRNESRQYFLAKKNVGFNKYKNEWIVVLFLHFLNIYLKNIFKKYCNFCVIMSNSAILILDITNININLFNVLETFIFSLINLCFINYYYFYIEFIIFFIFIFLLFYFYYF